MVATVATPDAFVVALNVEPLSVNLMALLASSVEPAFSVAVRLIEAPGVAEVAPL